MSERAKSLASRVVWRILVAQVLAVFVWLLVFMAMSPYISYDEVAAAAVRADLESALSSRPMGARSELPRVLSRLTGDRTGLEIAVASGSQLLASSPSSFGQEIEPFLAPVAGGGEWKDANGEVMRGSLIKTSGGSLLVITRGDVFLTRDLWMMLFSYVPQVLMMFAPALVAVTVVSPWAINSALRNVKTASAQASRLQLGSLDRGISEEGIPREIRPLVEAINRLLARLSEDVREREGFMANAAHEIRTPVAILSARVDSLEPSALKAPLQADARRLAALVDQLLSAARLQQMGAKAFQDVEFSGVVMQVVSDIAPVALRQGKQIEFEDQSDGAIVAGDREALRSAIMNLLDNAVKAEPVGGQIFVGLKRSGDSLEFEVKDNGEGIAPGHHEAIFDPFWRGRKNGAGTGLGLAIARRVVEMHEGTIGLESAPGNGATFIMKLPVIQAHRNSGSLDLAS